MTKSDDLQLFRLQIRMSGLHSHREKSGSVDRKPPVKEWDLPFWSDQHKLPTLFTTKKDSANGIVQRNSG